MRFLARFERDGDGFLVTFPSVPAAITGGLTREEARLSAIQALALALEVYAADGTVPEEDGHQHPIAGDYEVIEVGGPMPAARG